MSKPYGIVIAAALAVSGMTVIGCQNSDKNPNPDASVGGMTGGGSTDTYGTSSNARYKSTGNIGTDAGSQRAAPPTAVPNDTTYGNNPPMPAQTPVAPAGGAGSSTSTPGNTGNNQGSTTGGESGAGVRTEVRPPANTNPNNNTNRGTSGAAVGGTAGNGTSYNNSAANKNGGSSETGRSETGRSETSGTTR